jgi:hypothetical protein
MFTPRNVLGSSATRCNRGGQCFVQKVCTWLARRGTTCCITCRSNGCRGRGSKTCTITNSDLSSRIRKNISEAQAECAAAEKKNAATKSDDPGIIDCSKPPRASGKTPWWYKCHRENKPTKGMSVEQQKREIRERLEAKDRETKLLDQAERQGPPVSTPMVKPRDESDITGLPGGTQSKDKPTSQAALPTPRDEDAPAPKAADTMPALSVPLPKDAVTPAEKLEIKIAAGKKEAVVPQWIQDLEAPFPKMKKGEKLCSYAIPPGDPF